MTKSKIKSKIKSKTKSKTKSKSKTAPTETVGAAPGGRGCGERSWGPN